MFPTQPTGVATKVDNKQPSGLMFEVINYGLCLAPHYSTETGFMKDRHSEDFKGCFPVNSFAGLCVVLRTRFKPSFRLPCCQDELGTRERFVQLFPMLFPKVGQRVPTFPFVFFWKEVLPRVNHFTEPPRAMKGLEAKQFKGRGQACCSRLRKTNPKDTVERSSSFNHCLDCPDPGKDNAHYSSSGNRV